MIMYNCKHKGEEMHNAPAREGKKNNKALNCLHPNNTGSSTTEMSISPKTPHQMWALKFKLKVGTPSHILFFISNPVCRRTT